MAVRNGRVEVTDLPAPNPLRPVQRTIDTYAAPEKPPKDNSLAELGEALSGFSSALMRLGAAKVKPDEDPRLAEAYRVSSSLQDKDMIGALQRGDLPYLNVPHVRALYEKDVGERLARSVVNDIRTGAADGSIPLIDNEGRPIDIQGPIAERGREWSAMFPNSVHFQRAFHGGIESNRNALLEAQRGQVAEFNRQKYSTLVKSALGDLIPLAEGPADDATLRSAIVDRTRTAKEVVGMNPRDTDALLVGQLREYAKTNPKAALRILTIDRGRGADGQPIGSLANNPTYAREVREIVTTINNEMEQRYDVGVRSEAAKSARKALEAGDGSFNAITDYTYTNPFAARDPSKVAARTITRQSIQDEALNTFLQDSDAAIRRQEGGVPSAAAQETKFRREYEVFVNANRPHPVWKATLGTVGRILTNPASVSDPANVAKIEAAATLYQTLDRRNPGYVSQTLGLGDREQRFFDQYQVYKNLGDPPNEAARKASAFVNNPPPPLDAKAVKELRRKADGLDFQNWWPGGSVSNRAAARDLVFEAAKAIAHDRSVLPEDAIDAAVERIKSRAVEFNGRLVSPTPYLTNDNKQFYQKRLDELFATNKEIMQASGIGRATDLSLQEETPGVFRVLNKDGESVIIPRLDGEGNAIGYSTLYVHARDIDAIRRQSHDEAIAKTIEHSRRETDAAVTRDNKATPQQRKDAEERLDLPEFPWIGRPTKKKQ